jgi:CheY-like chemotaxis protein
LGQGTVTPLVSVPLIFGKCYTPDLVILDHSMPVLDGLGAARKIREIIPEVPIVMLSMHDGHS